MVPRCLIRRSSSTRGSRPVVTISTRHLGRWCWRAMRGMCEGAERWPLDVDGLKLVG